MELWAQLLSWSLDFIASVGDYIDWFLNFKLFGIDLSPAQMLLGSGFLVFMGFAIFKLVKLIG